MLSYSIEDIQNSVDFAGGGVLRILIAIESYLRTKLRILRLLNALKIKCELKTNNSIDICIGICIIL